MLLTLRWWCRKGRAVAIAVIASTIFLALAAAGGTTGASNNVMLDVKDAPLAQVVLMLTQQSNVNFIIADPEVNTKRITAHMEGKPLETVLANILKPAGIRYHKTEDGTYVIGEAGTDVTDAVEPPAVDTPVAQASQPEKPVKQMHYESIKLQNTSPRDILTLLGWTPGDTRLGNASVTNQSGADPRIPAQATTPNEARIYGSSGVIAKPIEDNAPPAMDSGKKPSEAGRAATPDEGASQYFGASARPNYGGATSSTAYPGGGGLNRPTTGQPNTGTSGNSNSLLPDGVDLVMPYDIDNSIVVRGDDDGIAQFKDLVHMLDIPPKQISIKAEFIEVSTNDIQSLGINWSVERLNANASTNFSPSGNVILGIRTGNVTADIMAELTNTRARVVNSPIISTLNNMPAQIQIGRSIPFFSSITQSVGNGQLVTSQQLVELPVTTFLYVWPRANGDGSVTMFLTPSVQDTGAIYEAPDGTKFPERLFQTVQTNRRIMSGETIVVGGFIRKNDTSSETKVPILGDLPFIGGLFRSKSQNADDRELLIFITPTILPEKTGGTVGVQP